MGVIILGTHRGGTSALAGVVHHLGFDAGPDDDRIGPTDDNPKGSWELEPLRDFNERLLIELGGRWSAPPAVDPDHLAALADGPWGDEAIEHFTGLLPSEQWVWKDPRLCVLLPFWRQVLPDELHVLVSVRHPEDVAHSLQRRDGFSIPYALALWERHQRQLMTDSEGLATYVVRYEALIDEPDATVAAVAAFLSSCGYMVEVDREGVTDALDASIRHHHSQQPLTDCPEASREEATLYEQLAAIAGEAPAGWGGDLPPETPSLQLAFDEHARMARWSDLSTQLRNGLEEVRARDDAKRAELIADIAQLEVVLEEQLARTMQNWTQVRRLEAEQIDAIEGREAVIEALETLIKERDGWKWTVLQHDATRLARARRGLRRALIGDEE